MWLKLEQVRRGRELMTVTGDDEKSTLVIDVSDTTDKEDVTFFLPSIEVDCALQF